MNTTETTNPQHHTGANGKSPFTRKLLAAMTLVIVGAVGLYWFNQSKVGEANTASLGDTQPTNSHSDLDQANRKPQAGVQANEGDRSLNANQDQATIIEHQTFDPADLPSARVHLMKQGEATDEKTPRTPISKRALNSESSDQKAPSQPGFYTAPLVEEGKTP